MEYRKIIETSFNNFLESIIHRETIKEDNIFTNIIIAGGAWEHWFKFELISKISNCINSFSNFKYSIEPEKKFIDITISKEKNKIWNIESIIELKISGNWHIVDKQLDNIIADIDKLKNYQLLTNNKFSLIFNTFAKPRHEIVNWIDEQIANGLGKSDQNDFLNKISNYIENKTKLSVVSLNNKSFSNEIFEQVTLSGFLIEVKD